MNISIKPNRSLIALITLLAGLTSPAQASFFANSSQVTNTEWRFVPGLGYYLPDDDQDGWIYTAYYGFIYVWDSTDGSTTMNIFIPNADNLEQGQTFWLSQAESPMMYNFERAAWVATWGNFRPWLPRIQSLENWREDVSPLLDNLEVVQFLSATQAVDLDQLTVDTANNTTHRSRTDNPHQVTAAQIGLGNVENVALSSWSGSDNITVIGSLQQVQLTSSQNGSASIQPNPTAANVSIVLPAQSGTLALAGDIGNLQTTATNLQNQITSNAGDISNLQTADSNLQAQITSNDGDISDLQTADTNLQTQIDANDSDITSLQTSVATAQSTADAAQADIDGFEDSLKNLTADEIAQLQNIDQNTISAEQWTILGATDQALATTDSVTFNAITSASTLGLNDGEFTATLDSATLTANQTLTLPDASGTLALRGELNSVDNDLQTQIDANDSDIAALQTTTTNLQTQVNGNEDDINDLQSTASGLQTQIASNDSDISDLETTDSALQTQITANDSDISVLQTNATNLQSQINVNESDINDLQTSVATAQNTADAAQADIDGFEDSLKNLTADEIAQLENIGENTISADQWAILAATDQGLATTDSVTFNAITSASTLGLNDGEFSATLDPATLTANQTLTLPDASGTLALTSDLDSLETNLQTQISGNDTDISDLETTDAGLQTQITANDGDIADLQTTDTDLQTQITANDSDINDLQTADTNLQSQIDSNDSDIASLQTSVATAQNTADAAQADIDGFEDSLKNLTADEIAQLENIGENTISADQWAILGATDQGLATTDSVTFNAITSASTLGLNDGEFSATLDPATLTANQTLTLPDASGTLALTSDLNSVETNLQNQIDANDSDILDLQTTDTDLQTQITANDGDIVALQTTDTDLQTQITANDGDIVDLQTTDTDLQTQITANDGDIVALQTTDTDLQTQITANDGDIADLQTADTNLQTQIDGNDTDIATLQTSVAAAQSAADTAQSTADTAQSTADTAQSTADTAQNTADAAQADIDGFDDSLKNLTADEIAQLDNIGENSISAEQWAILGATDQALATTDSVAFSALAVNSSVSLPTEAADPEATAGMIRYNTAGYLEFYHANAWVPVNSYED